MEISKTLTYSFITASAIILMMAYFTYTSLDSVNDKINKLEKSLAKKEIITKDVGWKRGKGFEEKFYVFPDGRKAYLEIDGKPVENYFPNK